MVVGAHGCAPCCLGMTKKRGWAWESWLPRTYGIPRLSLGMTKKRCWAWESWLPRTIGIPRLSLGMTKKRCWAWESWLPRTIGIPRLSLGMTKKRGWAWESWLPRTVGIPRLSLGIALTPTYPSSQARQTTVVAAAPVKLRAGSRRADPGQPLSRQVSSRTLSSLSSRAVVAMTSSVSASPRVSAARLRNLASSSSLGLGLWLSP